MRPAYIMIDFGFQDQLVSILLSSGRKEPAGLAR